MDTRTVRDALRALAERDSVGLRFEDQSWTWREHVQASIDRSRLLLQLRPEGPFHVGVLLDNVPEYPMLLGAGAFAGAALVGLNPTRRGAELERDVRHSDCQIIITETRHRSLLDGLDLGLPSDRLFDIDSDAWRTALAQHANGLLDIIRQDRQSGGAPRMNQQGIRVVNADLAAE